MNRILVIKRRGKKCTKSYSLFGKISRVCRSAWNISPKASLLNYSCSYTGHKHTIHNRKELWVQQFQPSQKKLCTDILKAKTYRTDSSRRTRVWILDLERDQETDEETEKGQLLQPTKAKDNKGNYTRAHSLRK